MQTFYRERANGRWQYWTYSDGQRYYVAPAAIKRADRLVTI